MPLEIISDENKKLIISQTGEVTQDDPIRSIEMDYSRWPVEISLNMMISDRVTISRIDSREQDDAKKLKGRESPTFMMFNDVENFVDAIHILKLKGITPELIARLNEKFAIAKANRPVSPRLTAM